MGIWIHNRTRVKNVFVNQEEVANGFADLWQHVLVRLVTILLMACLNIIPQVQLAKWNHLKPLFQDIFRGPLDYWNSCYPSPGPGLH